LGLRIKGEAGFRQVHEVFTQIFFCGDRPSPVGMLWRFLNPPTFPDVLH